MKIFRTIALSVSIILISVGIIEFFADKFEGFVFYSILSIYSLLSYVAMTIVDNGTEALFKYIHSRPKFK